MRTPTLKTWSLALAGLALLAALAGCSQDSTIPTTQAPAGSDNYEALDLSLPYGGLTASDEDVGFGDKAFTDMMADEDMQASDDPMIDDPEVIQMEEMAGSAMDSSMHGMHERPRFTFVRLEWGMIHGPDDSLESRRDCGVLDWSGNISVDRGLLVATRLIRFEFPQDHLVRPRPDRQTVGFVSNTLCNFDGLVLKIIERPVDQDSSLAPIMLHIATGPYTGDFELPRLVGMNENFPVDDAGNSLHITGYTLEDIQRCPKGFLNGRWRLLTNSAEDDTSIVHDPNLAEQYGTFGGPWVGLGGYIHGFMRCGYGLDADGNQVFYGKRINRMGRFMSFVSGTWTAADDGISLTGFSGDWESADGLRQGLIGGAAFPFPLADYRGGFYEGRWTTLCDELAEDQVR